VIMKKPTIHQVSKLPKWAVAYIREHRQAIEGLLIAVGDLDLSYARAQDEKVLAELNEATANAKVVKSTWPLL
jgi:hypothetical protein